ncbi:MAG: NifU family protein [Rhodobacteraceae bacterium]|nr:NifU family protein [Paracoccaceae bacterium]
MFIQTQSTPNPATMKFLPGQPVLPSGTADFPDPVSAQRSQLATRLFGVNGVTRVFFGSDFIAVTKSESIHWPHIKPPILGAIMEHFQLGLPIIDPDTEADAESADQANGQDSSIVRQIKDILDSRVRPAVAQDGGDIVFHGFERGVVYLHMQGACAGCPSSTITLKMGIENLLRHYIPEVVEVRPVV